MTRGELIGKTREILGNHDFNYSKVKEDPILQCLCLVLSIEKFDDELHKKYGNYEDEQKSMNDILGQEFPDIHERRIIEKALGVGEE